MKTFIKLFTLISIVTLFSCGDNDTTTTGSMEVEFDNIAIINGIEQQLSLVNAGSTSYGYTNSLGQKFNINLLRYYISAIELETTDGKVYKDVLEVSATASKGYYLIDEANAASQVVELENIPAGKYNKITFTVGVDSTGVLNGATGGALDPATSKMFWNWNSGYIALKFEGQSDVSNGGVSGAETVTTTNPNGIAYHIGGWKNIPGTAFVYNNKRVSFDFDTDAIVDAKSSPHVHMTFDVMGLFNGHHKVDFTGNHNVHKPSDGVDMAHNMEEAFNFDHIHQ
jgi:hypothetical protein